ncbi:multidrug effflux MFS transporter [Pseudemcibacter aquimaris]|uniref:multidrug effflux MFS transporter n=1 Tax=Pseudemcibacter aquimaris TaxID=2857064 RepID=UPI00201271B1|nr:multidrug effflux MFS transporter [Pseudemcibacter aquimaris]MCC3862251.1 multidrug effflux MFS transporter [Pseudemcibacter aquimaris]WDU59003.1 multidrug effflux MFS transporter [Pseudemcibacter aquimaris]
MTTKPKISDREFIALMAVIMSLVALAIDSMLPALSNIADDINIMDLNDSQWIISFVFFGMSAGLLFYGPLSDAYGRKPILYIGVTLFLIGDVISIMASDLTIMLVGRFLQGFGGAACRVITVAMVRDRFEGAEMAKFMSLIMMIFILVPALAPSVGQFILFFAGWEYIFGFMFLFGFSAIMWFHFRQYETLAPEGRHPFTLFRIATRTIEVVTNPVSISFTIASGIVFGSFIAYLNTSAQIMQGLYNVGDMFAVYFGIQAFVYGASSFLNSKLLSKYSMETICLFSLSTLTITSILFFGYLQINNHEMSFAMLMIYLSTTFFSIAPLYGNFNSMAMQPFGHMAGVATSVMSAIQTFFAVIVGAIVGQMYNGTVEPLVTSFMVCGIVTLLIFTFGRKKLNKAKA